MPRLKYSGGFRPGVEITHDDGRVEAVDYLSEIEVSATTRDNLIAQSKDDWTEIKQPSSSTKNKSEDS